MYIIYTTSNMKLVDISGQKKKEYGRAKINEPESNNKIKNNRDLYIGINDFKKGYQPRTNVVKNGKYGLVADTHSILGKLEEPFLSVIEYTWG
jgi:hypothetical protein